MEVFVMTTDKRQFTLRLNHEIHDKIKHIAELNRRSLTMQIEHTLEEFIRNFEAENGKIDTQKDTPQ
jgi:hypothetical protein